MRHARLLFPGLLLTGFLTSHCSLFDSKNSSDDDDDGGDGGGGQSGESTTGGSAGKGGSSAGRPSTGGTGGTGKGGSGTGGNDGGTTSVGGSSTGGSSSGGDANTGALGGTDPGAGGSVSTGGAGGSVESGGSGGTLGGTGGTGGSVGGTGGSVGTGGSAGGLTCSAGAGLALPIEPGEDAQSAWIDGSSNCVGIQGALYASVDLVGSTMTMTQNDGRVCVAGTATQVVGGDFANYWGARLVIQLNNNGDATALPYDAITHGVDGFRFDLSGVLVPEEIRPTFYNSASTIQYCKRVCAVGPQSILLSEATVDCWEGASGVTPTGSSLERIEFSIPSSATADVPYDFCIDGLTAITNNATVGNPGTCPETSSAGSCEGLCGLEADTCFCDEFCLDDLTGCCADFEAVCL